EDGTTGEALSAAINKHTQEVRSYAGGKLASHNVLLNINNLGISLTEGSEASVGAQYLAAAVAGAMASRPVASSLTRKGIAGFTKVKTLKTTTQKDSWSSSRSRTVRSAAVTRSRWTRTTVPHAPRYPWSAPSS